MTILQWIVSGTNDISRLWMRLRMEMEDVSMFVMVIVMVMVMVMVYCSNSVGCECFRIVVCVSQCEYELVWCVEVYVVVM